MRSRLTVRADVEILAGLIAARDGPTPEAQGMKQLKTEDRMRDTDELQVYDPSIDLLILFYDMNGKNENDLLALLGAQK